MFIGKTAATAAEKECRIMNISAFFEHLDGLFRAGQIDQVEPYILNQLVSANQEKDREASLAIINELISFYRSQQRYDEAIRVTQQALDLCRNEYIIGSLAHATTLLNGATAYRFAGQSAKALEMFHEAEAIYKEKLSPIDSHWGGLYNNMSAACGDLGRFDEAADYLLRAAAVMDAQPGHVIEAAVTHANLAGLYFKQQNYFGAKQHIATACNMLEGRPEAARQYAEFQAMKETLDKYPG